MPSTATHAQVKKLVIGGEKRHASNPVKLMLAEHGASLFATNSYWLVPAIKVRPLLDQFNLPTDKPAVYEVGASVTSRDQEPPRLESIMPATDAPTVERVRIDGEGSAFAYQRGPLGFLVMFRAVDGTLQAFNADFLDWIEGNHRDVTYRQVGAGKPLAIYDGDEFLGLLMGVRF